jgi:prolyl 4-hydroxylase
MSYLLEIDKNNIYSILNTNYFLIFGIVGIIGIIGIIPCLYIFRNKNVVKNNIKFIMIIIILIILLNFINCFNYYNKIVKRRYIQKIVTDITDNNYHVIYIKNLLTNEECDKLLEESNKINRVMEESKVYSEEKSIESNYRKSKQKWIKDNESLISKKITNIAKILTKKPVENMEELQLVEYDTNGYFKQHYDPTINEKNSNINDRAYTLLFYLNNVEDGGETYFNKLNLKVSPSKGDAVFFKSLDEKQVLLNNSLHQGMEIKKGKKYICNKWIHLNKFN